MQLDEHTGICNISLLIVFTRFQFNSENKNKFCVYESDKYLRLNDTQQVVHTLVSEQYLLGKVYKAGEVAGTEFLCCPFYSEVMK